MPRGIARSETTNTSRDISNNRKLNAAVMNTLKRIKDDLDPGNFTRAEFSKEFDTAMNKGESSGDHHIVDFDTDIALLIEAGYVEKLEKGYCVTEVGMSVEV